MTQDNFELREPIARFAQHMERRLSTQSEQTDNYTMEDCLARLREENRELLAEVYATHATVNYDAIVNKAADVANFAMMIADAAHVERTTPEGIID